MEGCKEGLRLRRLLLPGLVLPGLPDQLDQRPLDANTEKTAALHAALPASCIFVAGGRGKTNPVLANAVHCIPRESEIDELCADVSNRFGILGADCDLQALCPVARAVTALSRREQQVAVRVAAGLTSKQIASMLGPAIRTVCHYKSVRCFDERRSNRLKGIYVR